VVEQSNGAGGIGGGDNAVLPSRAFHAERACASVEDAPLTAIDVGLPYGKLILSARLGDGWRNESGLFTRKRRWRR